jgi:hypothetical protein
MAGARIARERGKNAALAEPINYADSCKGCHDAYRNDSRNDH